MNIVELQGTITDEKYFAVELEISGVKCILRVPEWQYSQLKVKLGGEAEAIREAMVKALKGETNEG